MPEPFLELNPNILVLPTVGINTWSRSSFMIHNNGYKEIFVKIKKPINIAFEFEYQIINSYATKTEATPRSKSKNNVSSGKTLKNSDLDKEKRILENQLTKINNMIEVKISCKSKTKLSFKVIL